MIVVNINEAEYQGVTACLFHLADSIAIPFLHSGRRIFVDDVTAKMVINSIGESC